MPTFLASRPPTPGEMMFTGRKLSGQPWMSATTLTSTVRTASTTLTTGTGAATLTTPLTGQLLTLATKFMGFCCLFFFLPWFILFCVCVWTIFKVLNLLKWCICFMFWFYCSMTCGILAPQPKMEPPSS